MQKGTALRQSLKIYSSFNYSMIVATLPDPTVRPPSRYQTGVLRCANGDFSCDSCWKIQIFHCVRLFFGNFVIMVLSRYIFFYYSICIFIGNPTLMKYLANACDKCSLYGGHSLNLLPFFCAILSANSIGILNISLKFIIIPLKIVFT